MFAEITKTIGEETTATCTHASKTYKGACFASSNCRIICQAEGAVSGHCQIPSFRCHRNSAVGGESQWRAEEFKRERPKKLMMNNNNKKKNYC
ncbi:hypothetical protein L6452_20776 [Arctium lappa]|uniref:Uncharacterized protein n=1 Tax=Arctium lappa TaxID=4217 RepID=A0ACB9BCB2_ARCLA|nr:hypothetical protein L6452_20776 [Arctium lappa]